MVISKTQAMLCLLMLLFPMMDCTSYSPTWESLDSRPLPSWYDEAKLGIFIHWGVFSVPSFSNQAAEWFWWNWSGNQSAESRFMQLNYKPGFSYTDFAKYFNAEFFNATKWVEIFKNSGAKYIVFVSKHHEGYTNWPSKYSFGWNSKDVGPRIDIVGELMAATREESDLKFGLYHSLYEWFNPLYKFDKFNYFETQEFVNQKTLPELYEIVNQYKPEIIWSDGDWDADADYWRSKDFLAWLYNESPVKDTVVTNDRWGAGTSCTHGGIFTCGDRYNPGVLQTRKWENAMSIDKNSWGFRRNAPLEDYLNIEELLQTFITTVSCGGNLLVNVGPPSHGQISPIYMERLRQLGEWMSVNGEGIYNSKPWTYQNDTVTEGVWYTKKATESGDAVNVYAFIFSWPSDGNLTLTAPEVSQTSTVNLLGYDGNISFKKQETEGIIIDVPVIPFNKMPCQWLWCFKITDVAN